VDKTTAQGPQTEVKHDCVVGTIEDGANGASVASGSSISPGRSHGVSASGTCETSSKNCLAFTWMGMVWLRHQQVPVKGGL